MITREIALARAQQIIASQKLDALVVASPWNVRYLAGTYFLTQKVIPDRFRDDGKRIARLHQP